MKNTEDVVKVLNDAFLADPIAMCALLINVVPCNKALADHPTIQVGEMQGGYTVRAMGLINGVLGALDLPLIASKWESETNADGEHELLGFMVYKKQE